MADSADSADSARGVDPRRTGPAARICARRPSRRGLLAGAVATGAAALLAACASGGRSTAGSSAAAGNASQGATESFPITIEHTYGSTTIEAEPTRIAAVSWVDADVVISLGMVPIGMPAVSPDADGGDAHPWTTEALEALGAGWDTGSAPAVYSATDGVDAEAIAALEPDLILGVHSGMSEKDYQRLSAIAPTLAHPTGAIAYGASWETVTVAVGRALGRSAAAEALVKTTTYLLTSTATANPVLSGATYAAAQIDISGPSIALYTTTDSRSQVLSQLGLTPAPAVIAAGVDTEDALSVALPLEEAERLNADLLWVQVEDAAAVEAIGGEVPLSRIPAVAAGTALFVTDEVAAMSLAAASPLSLPWCCENHVPDIVAAIEAGRAAATASAAATAGASAAAS
ncbi:ABC transporter substrate-binding protein [Actinomyces ruminicola]|uniref:Iron complex transport system substrate-binding protein n=1 Tax=Actinomyces ruminicola TaxID=332524 RepID=A0A1H0A2V8_9ACTO|nr:ABC transporter substrate-binding protein [Actinomyces ruminicola]SDN27755.1 iron complex transport system substrate-binding protein [Actinomyces ruminicola]